MKRKIIQIDEEKCNGCGLCIPNCQEGALQIIDGKARLISDLFCDGLGACLGHCPEGAIEIVEREAEPYKENNIDMSPEKTERPHHGGGCPGSREMDFRDGGRQTADGGPQSAVRGPEIQEQVGVQSELRQWPVQLHLLNPNAPYFRNADVVLTADCVPFAMGDYHSRYLKGKSVAIACPKLDSNKESYVEKLTSMIRDAKINTMQVIMMEVPCCGGLQQMAQMARDKAGRNVPIKRSVINLQGQVLGEEWV